jgi:hypothetical protein
MQQIDQRLTATIGQQMWQTIQKREGLDLSLYLNLKQCSDLRKSEFRKLYIQSLNEKFDKSNLTLKQIHKNPLLTDIQGKGSFTQRKLTRSVPYTET